ncbi:MAG TPA: hypothetical protein VFE05_06210 [Longimicrobiaceae bacterium]|jgi:hypothetical protein|nr:hypothetical protein [Longimicrobiaceae bacterium]
MVVGGLFVLTLVILGTRPHGAPAAPRRMASLGTPSAEPAPGIPIPPAVERAPGAAEEAIALDNLLSRYDGLIRLAEVRDLQSAEHDSAIAELRGLRARTYIAARRALADSVSARQARR